MRIEEIEAGKQVSIEVIKDGNKMEFRTEVRKTVDGCILTDIIMYNGHALKFDAGGIRLNVTYTDEGGGRFYLWENCVVRNIVSNGARYHMIVSQLDVKATNRREYYRVYVGLPGKARMGNTQELYDVMVKDLSQHGFGLVSDKDIEYARNPLAILFVDDEMLKLNIEGLIVRKNEIDEKHILYGCRFDKENGIVQKYINEKQREDLRRARAGERQAEKKKEKNEKRG